VAVIDEEGAIQYSVKEVTISYTDSMFSFVKSYFPHATNRLKNMQVLSMDERDVHFAKNCDMPDKEDAIQISGAERGECEIILTRDSKHFSKSLSLSLSRHILYTVPIL